MIKAGYKCHLSCGGPFTLCKRRYYRGEGKTYKRLLKYVGDDSLFTDEPIESRCKLCQKAWDKIRLKNVKEYIEYKKWLEAYKDKIELA